MIGLSPVFVRWSEGLGPLGLRVASQMSPRNPSEDTTLVLQAHDQATLLAPCRQDRNHRQSGDTSEICKTWRMPPQSKAGKWRSNNRYARAPDHPVLFLENISSRSRISWHALYVPLPAPCHNTSAGTAATRPRFNCDGIVLCIPCPPPSFLSFRRRLLSKCATTFLTL